MEHAGKSLLVVSGGVEAVPGIRSLRELGLRVVVSDRDPRAPGFDVADERLVASTYDPQETLRLARERHRRAPLHGVLSIAADVPRTVAAVAEGLGLPGPSPECARRATDKLLMKRCLEEHGVPVPWCAPVGSPAELEALRRDRGTLVLKPVDSRGARGVLRLVPGVDSAWAFATSLASSPSGRVMVEEFVPGPQLSTESLVHAGRVLTLACSDRNYELLEACAPFVIENGGCQPSVHAPALLPRVDELVLAAARALDLGSGVLKGDLVLDPVRGPVVVEVAPRLSGGWLSTDQVPLSTGIQLVQLAARLALGEDLRLADLASPPEAWSPVAVRYFFPPPGRVLAVRGVEELRREPWVHRLVLFAGPGDAIAPPTDHTRRAGLVITRGATRAEAVRRACEAVARVRFETIPAAA